VLDRAWDDTSLEATAIPVDIPKVAAYGFSSLSAILGDISALYTDLKVRLQLPYQNLPLTIPPVGGCCYQKQD